MAAPGTQDSTPLVLLASTTVTATGNSASFTLPSAECYALYLVAGTVSGTTPVMNAVLQTSLDNGTTWVNTGMYFGSVTTTGQSLGLVFKPTMGVGQSAGVITGTPGTASAVNQPVNRKFMRLSNTVTGTTPSIAYTLTAIAAPKGFSVV